MGWEPALAGAGMGRPTLQTSWQQTWAFSLHLMGKAAAPACKEELFPQQLLPQSGSRTPQELQNTLLPQRIL